MKPSSIILFQVLGAVLGAFVAILVFFYLIPLPHTLQLLLFLALCVVGFVTPAIVQSRNVRRQKRALVQALPIALDLLTICVESGLSLEEGIAQVVTMYHNPLSVEFQIVLDEIRQGIPRSEAFDAFADRVQTEEITDFVSAVNQSAALQSGLGAVLRFQSEELRRVRIQRAEMKGAKARSKILIPTIGCIFPNIFLVLMSPVLIGLFSVSTHLSGSTNPSTPPAASGLSGELQQLGGTMGSGQGSTLVHVSPIVSIFVVGFFTFCIVMILVQYLITLSQRRTAARLDSQLRDTTRLLASSIRSGNSFPQAFAAVTGKAQYPIKSAFEQSSVELQAGVSIEEVLTNLDQKDVIEDMHFMIVAALLQRKVGGNVAEVFDSISNMIKERIRVKDRIRLLTAQARHSGIFIAALPVFLAGALFFITPSYITPLVTTKGGLIVLGGILFNECLGFLIIYKITNIQV